ncbi:MAG: aminotransferase class III-fold pyridoxal phosphate-dependent enzyme [Candidatus Eremiobacteraeota bacterium]|nr:aminotransferase class III-fold pyridoxal phosphate-dependent enzyme [Candidatus Eremiobacteraeota bacterium]
MVREAAVAADRYAASHALYQRARAVIPGGIQLDGGKPLLRGGWSPLYFDRAQGAYVWDADGNRYIDFIMAYGPFVLGYGHQAVDAVAFAQFQRGNLISMNHPLHVQFIEELLQRFPYAEMGAFFKSGSEATTAALRIARRATGRRAVARCGYHGWHDWCHPNADFVPAALDEQVLAYDALLTQSLERLFVEHPNEIAAVILAPEMVHPPNREAVAAVAALAQKNGALFIMDEVKTGLRAPGGSMQNFYGIRPDLTTLSKALGNGWPIAALVGTRDTMRHGEGLSLSATYHGETSAMAAAIETMRIVERENAAAYLEGLGQRFITGLNAAAARNHVQAHAYGEPIAAMPFLKFADGSGDVKEHFYANVLAHGILLHPNHLWYVSTAHTERDIDDALTIVDEAMARLAQ